MKKVLMIANGGTIASKPTDSGLTPLITPGELTEYVPEISSMCNACTYQLFNLDSTDMNYSHWEQLAGYIQSVYEQYDSFVITHGTDTLAYAAAALSYLIQNSLKPIVLTGSQKSIYERDTDARRNLTDAFIYASDDKACGVRIVFDSRVIDGTRARKTRTKSFNAFSSVDYPEIAVIRSGKLYYYINDKKDCKTVFYDRLEKSVFVLKMIPGLRADIFDYIVKNYRAVIIESFGVGGIPLYDSNDFAEKIEMLVSSGIKVIFTTQVSHEGSDMEVYRVGYNIKHKFELIEAYDMTTEAVVAKTMWALANSDSDKTFRKLFLTPISKDIIS